MVWTVEDFIKEELKWGNSLEEQKVKLNTGGFVPKEKLKLEMERFNKFKERYCGGCKKPDCVGCETFNNYTTLNYSKYVAKNSS